VRFSTPFLKPVTFTTTRTGFRRPVLTSSLTASVSVALNNPVRRCFGRACIIPVNDSLKPMSNKRSASSMINISRDLRFSGEVGEVIISWRRPGVPIRIVGLVDLRVAMSFATEEVPPMSRFADNNETNSAGSTSKNLFSTE